MARRGPPCGSRCVWRLATKMASGVCARGRSNESGAIGNGGYAARQVVRRVRRDPVRRRPGRSEEHTSELQSLMRISYAVFCLKKKTTMNTQRYNEIVYKHDDDNYVHNMMLYMSLNTQTNITNSAYTYSINN